MTKLKKLSWIITLGTLAMATGNRATLARAPKESAGFTFLFRDVPKDWQRYEGQGFSMMVPPGLTRKDVSREDSRLTQLIGPKIQIEIRYGLHVGKIPSQDPSWRDFRVEEITLSGHPGHLISYINTNTGSPPTGKKFAADIALPEIRQVGRDSVGLSVKTTSLSSEDRGWAVTSLRSIIVPAISNKR